MEVHITVIDYDRVGISDAIGVVILGLGVSGTGLRHWRDMLLQPRRAVAQWHTLQPKLE